jgi:general secretion pathway protein C
MIPLRLESYFPWLVLLLLSTSAYFLACGATSLVASELIDERMFQGHQAPSPGPAIHRIVGLRGVGAEPIRKRNPFDSITGPLVPKPAAPTPDPASTTLARPLAAPECEGVDVSATTESVDPLWSLATIKGPGEPTGRVRRVGDVVADKQVAYIGYNPAERSPAVWLLADRMLCQSLLFDDDPPPKPAANKPAAKPKRPAPRPKKGPVTLPPDLAAKIKRVSDTEYHVDRSAIDTIMQRYSELMRSVRVLPEQKDGRVVGIRVLRIPPNTLLATLGVQSGDRIEKINGFSLSSPEKALQAYARLRTAGNISLQLSRKGRSMSIDYRIR